MKPTYTYEEIASDRRLWGESVTVSLHIPEGVTGASRIRIARLLGVSSRM